MLRGSRGSRLTRLLGLGRVSSGWIDLGPRAYAGLPSKFWVQTIPAWRRRADPRASTLEVFPAVRGAAGGQGDPGVPLCGTPTDAPPAPPSERHVAMLPPGGHGTDGGTILGLRQVEIAVDTDLAYFQLFNDPIAAGEYIVELYGAMSDLFIEEIRVRLDLTYFRLWTVPDPGTSPNPLTQFRNHWNQNQQSVHRDAAQLLLARRTYRLAGWPTCARCATPARTRGPGTCWGTLPTRHATTTSAATWLWRPTRWGTIWAPGTTTTTASIPARTPSPPRPAAG